MPLRFFESKIKSISYFTFLLTASALGLESDMIVEISVDYGTTLDGKQITANAWAREQNSIIKGYIATIHVAPGENEQERIFAQLNGSEDFLSNLKQFIAMLARQGSI